MNSQRCRNILSLIIAAVATMCCLGCGGGGEETGGINNPTNSGGGYTSEKELLSFGLASPTASGIFIPGENTVVVPVLYGTDVSALIATFTVSSETTVYVGSVVQIPGKTSNNFSQPITYVVNTPGLSRKEFTIIVKPGKLRKYFFASEDILWNYAPTGMNVITGAPFTEEEKVFTANGNGFIGCVYKKALYFEYTDDSFSIKKDIPPEWKHLGFLGPVIRAVVGDRIEIHYKNKASRAYSVHPHGVFYTKASEGTPYNDGTGPDDKKDDTVPPGGTWTYIWDVPERAGPGPMDGSSILWWYHSHVNEPKDGNVGLLGPMIVTAPGMERSDIDLRPKDVDREFVQCFWITDENDSWYLKDNIDLFASATANPDSVAFTESNKMHGINGFVYGNSPLENMTMKNGEHVRWYVAAFGNEVDLHTPHWHGNTFTWAGMRMDMIELLPMSMKTIEMAVDNPGIWLEHCHVNDHIKAGMITRYQVIP
ncbi:MAG: multicopper oxidase domain-containing protein [Candidatus Riflebacteria bacterium]|nr:multicopper oxidase domain-containing protein [Candidatus Riflebacteria bacterium]